MKDSEMFRIFLLVISVVLFIAGCECEKESGLPVDGDGNVYDTVVIGTQVWLKQNLKTTRYRDGTPIPLVTDNDKWASMTVGAYCWYNNNPVYKENYGGLYNWYAMDCSGTNESGFTARPGSSRAEDGTFSLIGFHLAAWWTTTSYVVFL